jgi:hypothetical protein
MEAPKRAVDAKQPSDPAPEPTSTSTAIVDTHNEQNSKLSRIWRQVRDSKIYGVLSWTPPHCRWNPEKPPQFSMTLNVLFAFAGCFTVANLYYNHPILNVLAKDFNVTYEEVSRVPTLMQGGYAAGLLFLCPLGDLFKRRPFVLLLVLFTATTWYV